MRREEYLKTVEKQIQFFLDRNSICKELEDHIIDSMYDLMEDGMEKEEAERIAIEQMGDPIEVGKQLNKEHHPLLGYAWIISKIVLMIMIFVSVSKFGYTAYEAMKMTTPSMIKDALIVASLDIEHDMQVERLVIDYIYQKQGEEDYYLTYRSFKNFSYSRSNWSSMPISIIGNERGGASQGNIIGSQGYVNFVWPEDHQLTIRYSDGEIEVINLKVYCDET